MAPRPVARPSVRGVPWPAPPDLAAVTRAGAVVAHDDVDLARAGVVAAARVPWVGAAAESYRAAVAEQQALLDRLRAALEALLTDLAVPGSAGPGPAAWGRVLAGATCWGASGRSLRLGAGTFVAVDPEALADAAGRLERASEALDGASAALVRALWAPGTSGLSIHAPTGGSAARVGDLLTGPLAPGRAAARLRELAGSARAAAQLHRDGESRAHQRLRGAAVAAGHVPLVGAVEAWAVGTTGLLRAGWRVGFAAATGDDPLAGARREAGEVWSEAVAAGGVEVTLQGVAGALTSAVPPVLPDAVPVACAGLAALLAPGGAEVTLVPRVDPPQLPAPHGLAGILAAVATTYDDGQPTGLPGTPTATLTVQRLDHPDGSRSWLVAVPGTQSWGFEHDVATDMGTNLRLVGGLPDAMTAGVLAALGAAGVAADEPVVLAGHSQGGMVALAAAAAAAGTYRIGGVVTAGSPSVPGGTPPGVPVVRLEHDEDVVPQADGEPTRAGGDVTRVTRSLADDHPVLPTEAHGVAGYVRTAGLTDAAVAAAPGSSPGVTAVTGLLGADGTTATTWQYRVERAADG